MGREGPPSDNAALGYAIVGAMLIAVIGAGYLLRDHLTGSPTELKVGDCFNESAVNPTGSVSHIPCPEPHTAEVFVVGEFAPAADYPPLTAFQRWTETNCTPGIAAAYIGETAVPTSLGIALFYPTSESWYPEDGVPTTGSVRASPAPSD